MLKRVLFIALFCAAFTACGRRGNISSPADMSTITVGQTGGNFQVQLSDNNYSGVTFTASPINVPGMNSSMGSTAPFSIYCPTSGGAGPINCIVQRGNQAGSGTFPYELTASDGSGVFSRINIFIKS